MGAHFSVAMMYICRFVDKGNSLNTTTELVMEINISSGVANTVADLVYIDREHSNLLAWENFSCICKLPRLN